MSGPPPPPTWPDRIVQLVTPGRLLSAVFRNPDGTGYTEPVPVLGLTAAGDIVPIVLLPDGRWGDPRDAEHFAAIRAMGDENDANESGSIYIPKSTMDVAFPLKLTRVESP